MLSERPHRRRRTTIASLGAFVLRVLVLPIGLFRGVVTALHAQQRGARRYVKLANQPRNGRSFYHHGTSSKIFNIASQHTEMRVINAIGHREGAADPRTRFRFGLRGVKIAYGVLPIGRLRALLREPKANAPQENMQKWQEISFMHESRHLYPVPTHVKTEVQRVIWALLVILVMLFLGGYLGGYDVHAELLMEEFEHEEALAAANEGDALAFHAGHLHMARRVLGDPGLGALAGSLDALADMPGVAMTLALALRSNEAPMSAPGAEVEKGLVGKSVTRGAIVDSEATRRKSRVLSHAQAEHGVDSGSSHGEEGNSGHGHHDTSRLDSQIVIVIVIGLILLTIFFEWIKERAEEAVPREMSGVLEHIFGELTVLGFLAMVTYLAIAGNIFAKLSKLLYGDEQHLLHLFERVHADLFYVMIAFAFQAVWLIVTSFLQSARWQDFERFVIAHAKVTSTSLDVAAVTEPSNGMGAYSRASRRSLESQIDAAALEVLYCQGQVDEHGGFWRSLLGFLKAPLATARLSEARRQLRYTLLRYRFIRLQMLSPNFEMHSYLRRRVAAQVSHSIHMQPATWAMLVLLLAPCMELIHFAAITGERYIPKDTLFYVNGIGLFLISYLLRHHVQELVLDLTPEHPLLVPCNRLHLSPEQRAARGEQPQAWKTTDGLPRKAPWGERSGVVHYWRLPRFERHNHWSRSACGSGTTGQHRHRWSRGEVLHDIAARLGGKRFYWLGDYLDLGRSGAQRLWGLQAYMLLFNAVYMVVVTDVGKAMGVETSWGDAAVFMILPAATIFFLTPDFISSLTMAASVETHADRASIHAVEREMKLKGALRLLIFLFQLNTLLGAKDTAFQRRLYETLEESLRPARLVSRTRAPRLGSTQASPSPAYSEPSLSFSLTVDTAVPGANPSYIPRRRARNARVRIIRADPNRQAEWLELWDEMLAARSVVVSSYSAATSAANSSEAYNAFARRFALALGVDDPWLIAEAELEEKQARAAQTRWRSRNVQAWASDEGADSPRVPPTGVLTITLFAWFICRQRSVHMAFLHPEELLHPTERGGEDDDGSSATEVLDEKMLPDDFRTVARRVRGLFCDMRRLAFLSHQTLVATAAEDRRSTGRGENAAVAETPMDAIDPAERRGVDDWGISYEDFSLFMAEMQVRLERHATEIDLCEAVFDSIAIDRIDAKSRTSHLSYAAGKTDDANSLTRQELGAAFEACHSFDAHVIDEFLYLFPLDSDGAIPKTSFLTVADQLDALRYDDGFLFQHTTSRLRNASNFASAGMSVHHDHGHSSCSH